MRPIVSRRGGLLLALLLLLPASLGLAARGAARPGQGAEIPQIELVSVAEGFSRPVDIANAGDARLFVVEQSGLIRIAQPDGTVLEPPFLDLTDRVGSEGYEQGLLGLAFHPDYATNGYFYVNYTNLDGDTRISRFQVTGNPDVADPGSELIVLAVDQPFPNHNGGDLAFGPDGYLYIGLGDGGSANDPDERAQNGTTLLGKMLRLDVDGGSPYAIPADNPFVSDPNIRPEIWAFGLRNPWRFSFDRLTGDMYIGDVGQGLREEIDFQPASSDGGENYGWDVLEGSLCHEPSTGCDPTGKTFPVAEYDHQIPENGGDVWSAGYAVTGGFVYRGSRYPLLQGTYLFADYATRVLWTLRRDDGGNWQMTELGIPAECRDNFSTFGEGADGELYLACHEVAGSPTAIYRIQDARTASVTYLPLVFR